MLTQFYPPVIGGEERHVRNLSRELVSRGHEVHVVTQPVDGDSDLTTEDGVVVHRVSGWTRHLRGAFARPQDLFAPPVPDPGMVRALRSVIRAIEPDLIHAHNWIVNSAIPLRRATHVPIVLTLHDYSHRCATKRYMHNGRDVCSGPAPIKCLGCAARKYKTGVGLFVGVTNAAMIPARRYLIDAVICVSSAVATRSATRGLAERTVVIPNFVPSVEEIRVSATQGDLPEGWPDEEPLLFVGDLSRDKGVPELLDAYSQLRASAPLVLIGKAGDVVIRDGNGVRAFHDRNHADVLAVMLHSRAVIVPSVWPDPCPTVVLEAMACARPVVASATGGIVDLVANGQTGLLVEPGDTASLRAAMSSLLANRAISESYGAAAQRAVERFTAQPVTDEIETVYRLVTQPPSAVLPAEAGR